MRLSPYNFYHHAHLFRVQVGIVMVRELRGAIDIGSGSTKIAVLLVEYEVGQKYGRIIENLYGREHSVSFGGDYKRSSTGELSVTIQDEGIATLKDMVSYVRNEFKVTKFSAICTEVFRNARNGSEYLDRIRLEVSVPVTIITQLLEAELSFNSIIAVSELDRSKVCVWDSGGASFQITSTTTPSIAFPSGEFQTYMGPLGTHISTSILVEECRGQSMKGVKTVNPVSREEIPKLIEALKKKMESDIPDWLKGRDVVFGAAGQASMFKLCCDCLHSISEAQMDSPQKSKTVRKTSFTAYEARLALDSFVALTDEEIVSRINIPAPADGADLLIPKLALLCAVLDMTGIKEVKTICVVGSCAGMAIDNTMWKFQYDTSSDGLLNVGDKVQIVCKAAGNNFMRIANVIDHVTSSPLCSLFNFISYFDVYRVKIQSLPPDAEEDVMMITRNNLRKIFCDGV